MTREELIKVIYDNEDALSCPEHACDKPENEGNTGECCWECAEKQLKAYEDKIRKQVIKEIKDAMYHQCFECDNDEDMQKWDGGNWIRYKLFENVIEQLKEKKEWNGLKEK